jgi:hypothetical protein
VLSGRPMSFMVKILGGGLKLRCSSTLKPAFSDMSMVPVVISMNDISGERFLFEVADDSRAEAGLSIWWSSVHDEAKESTAADAISATLKYWPAIPQRSMPSTSIRRKNTYWKKARMVKESDNRSKEADLVKESTVLQRKYSSPKKAQAKHKHRCSPKAHGVMSL